MAANKVWLINKWLLLGEYVGMILKGEKCCLVIWFRVLWHIERKFENEKREELERIWINYSRWVSRLVL